MADSFPLRLSHAELPHSSTKSKKKRALFEGDEAFPRDLVVFGCVATTPPTTRVHDVYECMMYSYAGSLAL
jgi:hypothetical protein